MKNVFAAAAILLAFAAPTFAQSTNTNDDGFRVQEQSNHGSGTDAGTRREPSNVDPYTTQSITPVQPKKVVPDTTAPSDDQGTTPERPSTNPAR